MWRRLRYMLSPQLDLYESIAPLLKDKLVLEVGFGTGAGTLQLAKFAKQIASMEVEGDAVAFAQQVFPLGNLTWFQADILEWTSVHYYDAVVMIEVLEHITDWRAALYNVAEQLKIGGKLYISARNRYADLRRNEKHEREWTAQEFKLALQELFSTVTLFDYTLQEPQDLTTHITPLIAVATK